MKIFFDTSSLIKRYIEEIGSDKILEICQEADSLVISIICPVEMISTLNRLVREKALSKREYNQVKTLIFSEIEDMEVVPVQPEVVRCSILALERSPLRAMDAIHIGSALLAKPELFVSSDKRQLAAAKKAGLKILSV